MSTVESLVRRLSEVQDLLIALPDDAFAEREELIRQRDELQAQAAHHAAGADHERPAEDLLAELASLQIQRSSAASEEDGLRIEGRISRLEGILDERNIERAHRS